MSETLSIVSASATAGVVGAFGLSSKSFSVFTAACYEIVTDNSFVLRCVISGVIAMALYIAFGLYVSHFYPREVSRKVFAWSWKADFPLAIISLLIGSPLVQAFGVAHDKWGIMKTYTDITEHGWIYYFVSIPLYLFLWDAVFFTFHFMLHFEPLYSMSHAYHHAFRPPVAWSGIAIDPVETVFNGLAPYLVPLFIMPFHTYTVYAINVMLVGWALLLHSSSEWKGNWLLVGTDTHNIHHSMGIRNGNYGAIFKIFDRIFGTIVENKLPYWMEEEKKAREEAKAAAMKELLAKVTTSTREGRLSNVKKALSIQQEQQEEKVVAPQRDIHQFSSTSASDNDSCEEDDEHCD